SVTPPSIDEDCANISAVISTLVKFVGPDMTGLWRLTSFSFSNVNFHRLEIILAKDFPPVGATLEVTVPVSATAGTDCSNVLANTLALPKDPVTTGRWEDRVGISRRLDDELACRGCACDWARGIEALRVLC